MSLTGLAFLGCFGALLVLAFVRSPMYGLYAYLAAFYAHPPSRWWGADLPDLRWALLASLVTLVAVLSKKSSTQDPKILSQPPMIILVLFTIWLWIQTPWALYTNVHIEFSSLFTKYLVLVFLLYRLLRTEVDIRNFLLANVAGCGYLGYLAWKAGGGGRLEGVGGPGIGEANALGMQLGVGLVFAAMLLLVLRNRIWFLVLVPIPLMANGLIQTQSRSAFLGVVVAGLALWYLKPPGNSKRFYILAALALAGFMVLASAYYWQRIGTIRGAVDEPSELDASARSRFVIAAGQWEMFKTFPLGVGHRGTAALSPIYIPEQYLTKSGATGTARRSSHNTFLSVLVEQGVPGVLLFVALMVWAAVSLKRLKRMDRYSFPSELGAYRAAAGAGLVLVVVSGVFVDYIKAEVQIWCISILLALIRIAKQEYGMGTRKSSGRSASRIIGAPVSADVAAFPVQSARAPVRVGMVGNRDGDAAESAEHRPDGRAV